MSNQNEPLKEEKTKLEKELDGFRSAIESFDQECGTDTLTVWEEEKRVANSLKEINEQINRPLVLDAGRF
jgi:hypothetical protein